METHKTQAQRAKQLHSRQFKCLLKEFAKWLEVLGYSESVRQEYPRNLKRFFEFLEENGITTLKGIDKEVVSNYHAYLLNKPNERRGGKIGSYHVNSNILAVKKLLQYLLKTEGRILPLAHIKPLKIKKGVREYLSSVEVSELFNATHPTSRFGYRDRAILAIFYGCGLRRNEGVNILVKDIDLIRGFIHVREGKGCKERFVPMSKTVEKHLSEYLKKGRPLFIKSKYNGRLFLSHRGNAVGSQALYHRLKHLQRESNLHSLKQKQIGLHTLRHSIATHLLEKNVPLETIAQFLGHSTLESTQIYTHVNEEMAERI